MALAVERADIAGVQDAITQRGLRCRLILPVARHDVAATDQHFADRSALASAPSIEPT